MALGRSLKLRMESPHRRLPSTSHSAWRATSDTSRGRKAEKASEGPSDHTRRMAECNCASVGEAVSAWNPPYAAVVRSRSTEYYTLRYSRTCYTYICKLYSLVLSIYM